MNIEAMVLAVARMRAPASDKAYDLDEHMLIDGLEEINKTLNNLPFSAAMYEEMARRHSEVVYQNVKLRKRLKRRKKLTKTWRERYEVARGYIKELQRQIRVNKQGVNTGDSK